VGGGIIIVPALAWAFRAQGFPEEVIMHLAVGTSLATIVLTSVSSVRAHHRRRAVLWRTFFRLSPGFAAGALIGAATADALKSENLELLFGTFVCLVGIQLLWGARPTSHRELPGRGGLLLAGTLIGTLSAIVGIGGGNLTVPFLAFCNVAIRNAVATGAAAGLPIATVGAASYVVAGHSVPDLPAWSSGYVYGPAFIGIAVASVLFAPFGARLTHHIPTHLLRRGFGLFLIAVGVRMLVD
jgi:uncharacterized membrane protein YfcA